MIHNTTYLFLLTRSYCDLCSFAPVVKVPVTVIADCWFVTQKDQINERKALNLQNKYKPLPLRYSLPVVCVLCKIMVVFQRLAALPLSERPLLTQPQVHTTSQNYQAQTFFTFLCNPRKYWYRAYLLPCCVWGLWLVQVIKKLHVSNKKSPNPNGKCCG